MSRWPLAAALLLAAAWLHDAPAMTANPPSVVPLALQFGPAPMPVSSDGRDHLLYEMRVTNFSGRNITIAQVEVIDGASGALLARHVGEALAGMIGTPGRDGQADGRRVVAPGSFVILFFDTVPPARGGAGRTLLHRIRIEADRPDLPISRLVAEAQPLPVAAARPPILGAPLRGSGWLAANALSNDADHRRTIAVVDGRARIAQRYAIDFLQLDRLGRAFSGDPSRNESWTGYGSPVLAVADGVIEAVRDGIADNRPLAAPSVPITLDTIGGNHIVLRLPGGRRVFYGHLKPGSILVRAGQRVRHGQVVAALGNSGQSDAPHLHIHVADGPSPLGAEGLAFAFRRFMLEGRVPSLDIIESPAGWQRPADATPQIRIAELPSANAVIAFGPDRHRNPVAATPRAD